MRRFARPVLNAAFRALKQPLFLAGLVIAGGLWGFGELAEAVTEGGTKSFDESVILALREPHDPADLIGPPVIVEVLRDVTALGSVTVLSMLTAAVCGFLWLCRRHDLALFAFVAAVGGGVLTFALKAVYARPRPDLVPYILTDVDSASFPSGHAMASAAVYLSLGAMVAELAPRWPLKVYVMTVAVVLTVVVGVTRVFLGVHYPTDVLAGWAGGMLWAYGCRSAVRLLRIWRTGRHVSAAPGGPPHTR